MSKRVLIYMPINKLAPVGGPRGYLYHLKRQLDKIGIDNISFLPEINKEWRIEKMIPSLKPVCNIIRNILSQYIALSSLSHKSKIDLSKYDIIHFHDTFSMYSVRDSLKDYKGKVVLTSHSPIILSREWKNEASRYRKILCGRMLDRLIEMDEYSFKRADYLFFPCENAEDPYYNSWDEFKNIKELKKDRFRYIPSGINPCVPNVSKEEILKKYSIPNDAIIFSYVGRHNEIKGYDRLKTIGSHILSKFDNVYFLIAGVEKPMHGLKHPRWIEIGWTKDPHSVIAASDAFILPNRETYFDLVMLEVLSLGKMVIASNTGGNKYFNKFNSKGIRFFTDNDEAYKVCKDVIVMDKNELGRIGEENKKLFFDNFTIEIFADAYIKTINEI